MLDRLPSRVRHRSSLHEVAELFKSYTQEGDLLSPSLKKEFKARQAILSESLRVQRESKRRTGSVIEYAWTKVFLLSLYYPSYDMP